MGRASEENCSRTEREKSKSPGEPSTPDRGPKEIAITRPVGKGKDTAEFVRDLGWTPFIFHTVELKPIDDQKIKREIQSSLNSHPVDWIVFMSSGGVELLFEAFRSHPSMQDPSYKTAILAVGPTTRKTLLDHGATEIFLPDRYSSEGVDQFFSRLRPQSLRIVLVRSSSADDSLAHSLSSRGAFVTAINAYESNVPRDLESTFYFIERLSKGGFSAVLFTSARSVSNLFEIAKIKFEESKMISLLKGVLVGAIGPATAEELSRRGIDPILPEEYLIESALRKLIEQMTDASS